MRKKLLFITIVGSLAMQSIAFAGKKGYFSDDINHLDHVLNKNIDNAGNVLTAAAATSGAALITGAATAIKTQAAVALTAAKGVAIVAAPYVAGGTVVVAVGYAGYKWYQSSQPSEEKFKTQLQNCLFNNKNGPFNKHRIPEKCTEEYKNFAIWAGDAKAQDKVEAFKKCS